VSRFVSGRSFADIGCMGGVDGAIAFAAEEAGASEVVGLDVMAPTDRFEHERARLGSRVRFVHGDVHDDEALARVGVHDIVWCSGLVYHVPHPLLTLGRLRSITGETLILASETFPEVRGLPQACWFLPGLPDRERRRLAALRSGCQVGLTTPFDPAQSYGNWFWAFTPSCLAALVRARGFDIVEQHRTPLHTTLVARRRAEDPLGLPGVAG
jgi:SAM-dependent methyltransferase